MSEKNPLYEALAKAQGETRNPPKDKEAVVKYQRDGNWREKRYKYSDLSSVIDSSKAVLSKYGLSIIQKTGMVEGRFGLITRLVHESGQFEESFFPLPNPENMQPQQLGSLLTYLRRYSRTAILDVMGEEDDDAVHASETEPEQPKTVVKPIPTPVSVQNFATSEFAGMTIEEAWEKKRARSVMKCFELQKAQRAGKKILPWEKTFFEFGVVNKLFNIEQPDA